MPSPILERIQQLVREWRYEVTDHAWDEMAEDNLLLADVETAILTGEIVREDKGDPRGTVYVIHGVGTDRQTAVGAAVRFNQRENTVIITAYKVE
jgi:aspartate 1-decarboxylase